MPTTSSDKAVQQFCTVAVSSMAMQSGKQPTLQQYNYDFNEMFLQFFVPGCLDSGSRSKSTCNSNVQKPSVTDKEQQCPDLQRHKTSRRIAQSSCVQNHKSSTLVHCPPVQLEL